MYSAAEVTWSAPEAFISTTDLLSVSDTLRAVPLVSLSAWPQLLLPAPDAGRREVPPTERHFVIIDYTLQIKQVNEKL